MLPAKNFLANKEDILLTVSHKSEILFEQLFIAT